ncbi:hypothetical protein Tco_0527980 [Tanacetum coccineum]
MSLEESNDLNILNAKLINPVVEANSLPKFNMHLYKSSLTKTHVKWAAPIAMAWRHHDSSVADPFPASIEYDVSDAAKIREVVIALRKPPPSLLYVAGLSHVWKHAGRAFSLKDPKGKGWKVVASALLTPGSARVTHLANPAERLEDLPPKTGNMVTAKIPCQKVLDDKENKKRKAEAKAAANAPDTDIQVKKVAGKRGVGKEGIRKKRRADEHVTPRLVANVDKPASDRGKDQHNIDHAFANEGHGNNEDGLSGLRTQPSPAHHLDQRLEFMEKHACDKVVSDVEANIKVRYKECKKELVKLQSGFDEIVLAYGQLSQDYDAVLTREQGLQDRVKELEKEKAKKEELRADRGIFTVECGQGEMVWRKIINEYLPTLISIGPENPDIQAIRKATPNVDPASSDTFMETYEKLFDKRYPYVNKVARAYLLDPTGLQNVMPNETDPTLGGRPRDTPTTSYA